MRRNTQYNNKIGIWAIAVSSQFTPMLHYMIMQSTQVTTLIVETRFLLFELTSRNIARKNGVNRGPSAYVITIDLRYLRTIEIRAIYTLIFHNKMKESCC